jgi:hypothetical protein
MDWILKYYSDQLRLQRVKEIITVYFENDMKCINKLCGQNAEWDENNYYDIPIKCVPLKALSNLGLSHHLYDVQPTTLQHTAYIQTADRCHT